jgi:hypothetical protein
MSKKITPNTNQNPLIITSANSYLRKRISYQVTDIEEERQNTSNEYVLPQLLHFYDSTDEKNRLITAVKRLVHNKTKLDDILIITPSTTVAKALEIFIQETLDVPTKILRKSDKQDHHIGICTLSLLQTNTLQSPFVFITGLNEIYSNESIFPEGTQEKQDLITKQTHQLVTAMKRAEQELTLFLTAKRIPQEFISKHFHTPTTNDSLKAKVRFLHG